MKTLTDATFYTVTGPTGTYYAVRDHDTGAVLTERTETGAAALANEKDLLIVERGIIDHARLMQMMASRFAGAAPGGLHSAGV